MMNIPWRRVKAPLVAFVVWSLSVGAQLQAQEKGYDKGERLSSQGMSQKEQLSKEDLCNEVLSVATEMLSSATYEEKAEATKELFHYCARAEVVENFDVTMLRQFPVKSLLPVKSSLDEEGETAEGNITSYPNFGDMPDTDVGTTDMQGENGDVEVSEVEQDAAVGFSFALQKYGDDVEYLEVTAVLSEDLPLEVGDRILAVRQIDEEDWTSIAELDLAEDGSKNHLVTSLVRGPLGTEVHLKVERVSYEFEDKNDFEVLEEFPSKSGEDFWESEWNLGEGFSSLGEKMRQVQEMMQGFSGLHVHFDDEGMAKTHSHDHDHGHAHGSRGSFGSDDYHKGSSVCLYLDTQNKKHGYGYHGMDKTSGYDEHKKYKKYKKHKHKYKKYPKHVDQNSTSGSSDDLPGDSFGDEDPFGDVEEKAVLEGSEEDVVEEVMEDIDSQMDVMEHSSDVSEPGPGGFHDHSDHMHHGEKDHKGWSKKKSRKKQWKKRLDPLSRLLVKEFLRGVLHSGEYHTIKLHTYPHSHPHTHKRGYYSLCAYGY